ncbi:IclR family transcriptional regulator [Hoeflea sp.]|uniref:IclR family transcriptional regulator n=1 Tax=Hoeflea sp. TaxID=1940281 RepID=UPI003BAF1BE4
MNAPPHSDGTVGKALEILDSVAAHGRPVRFTELLETSTYPKATLYRFLQILTNQNMLDHNPEDGSYSLGTRLIRLAHAAWKNASLAPIARPHVQALAKYAGETIHLAQLDNAQVIFVDKLKATNRFETLAQVGQVAPAYCTGVGKAMLAFLAPKRLQLTLRQQSYYRFTPTTLTDAESLIVQLEQIRREGVAYDRQEHELGIISIAAPVLSSNGRVLGAISIATSTTRHSLEGLEAYRAELLKTAETIGAEATNWQFPS